VDIVTGFYEHMNEPSRFKNSIFNCYFLMGDSTTSSYFFVCLLVCLTAAVPLSFLSIK
jgi:hypothetical protein